MFADRVRIDVQGGRGGDGALSFRREKYVPKGGPDGGDGGDGGDVVLVADPDLRDLAWFRGRGAFTGGRGRHGEGRNRRGADGEDVVLRVPVGTQVLEEEGGIMADLAHPGGRAVVARGGKGGFGNRHFVSPTRRTPRVAEPGAPGERAAVELRLKLLVDAALLGFPNAGKSSLLRRISNATPKVADYPFTTLVPVLGTVDGPDGRQLVVADVPGLLEGASMGVGLGHEFLAHLERARLLVHVIDASEPDPEERFHAIDRELAVYGAGLAERSQIVVLNKLDLCPAPPPFVLEDPRVVAVVHASAATGAGIPELVQTLFRCVPPAPRDVPAAAPLADFLVYRPRPPERRTFRVLRTDRGWIVVGPGAGSAPPDVVEKALREAGARPGDLVEIAGEALEWA